MRLRAATERDVDAVYTLDREAFGNDGWSADTISDELIGPRRRAMVAAQGAELHDAHCVEQLIGFAISLEVGDGRDLLRVVVHPERRRHGVARALVAAVCGDAPVLLEVAAGNPGAIAFYRSLGFGEIDRRRGYYRDGSDAIVMRRECPHE